MDLPSVRGLVWGRVLFRVSLLSRTQILPKDLLHLGSTQTVLLLLNRTVIPPDSDSKCLVTLVRTGGGPPVSDHPFAPIFPTRVLFCVSVILG